MGLYIEECGNLTASWVWVSWSYRWTAATSGSLHKDHQCRYGGSQVHYQRQTVCQVCRWPKWPGGSDWYWGRNEGWVSCRTTLSETCALGCKVNTVRMFDPISRLCMFVLEVHWTQIFESSRIRISARSKNLESFWIQISQIQIRAGSEFVTVTKGLDACPSLPLQNRTDLILYIGGLTTPEPFHILLYWQFLATPASSVYSERLFSEYDNIFGEQQARLLPRFVEKLLCHHHNLKR